MSTMRKHFRALFSRALGLGLALGFAAGASPARAAEPVSLGDFDAWTAWALDDAGARECGVSAEPKSSQPAAARRSDVAFVLTHRPAEGAFYEPAWRAGYAFSAASKPFAQIGAQRFQLITGVALGRSGEGRQWAWLDDPDDAPRLVDALRGGVTMIVKGRSSRETLTTDTYDLNGVTMAVAAMDAACL